MVVALFVTAKMPIETVNEVLKAGTADEGDIAVFCLIRSPSQETYNRFTFEPVEAFSSGFLSASIEELGAFRESIGQKKNGLMQPDSFAVLDERFLKDRTVGFVCKTSYRRGEVEDNDDDDEAEDEDEDENESDDDEDDGLEEWQSVRIAFEDIREGIYSLSENEFLAFGPQAVELVDENGVWHPPQQPEGSSP